MKEKLTSIELEHELLAKNDAIKARIDALKGEVATTGEAVRDAVMKSPLVSVGSAVAAGLVVGLIFGGRDKKKVLLRSKEAHRELLDGYMDALTEDVRVRARSSGDVGEAVRAALGDRLPLIVYAPAKATARRGIVRQAGDLVLKTAIGFGVKMVFDMLTAHIDVEKLQEQIAAQTDEAETKTPTFQETGAGSE